MKDWYVYRVSSPRNNIDARKNGRRSFFFLMEVSSSFLSTVETDSLKRFIVDICFRIEPDRTSRTVRSYRKLINMHLNFRFEYSSKYAFSVSYTSNLISSLRSERDNLQHGMICQKQDVSYIKFLGEDIRRKGDWGTC